MSDDDVANPTEACARPPQKKKKPHRKRGNGNTKASKLFLRFNPKDSNSCFEFGEGDSQATKVIRSHLTTQPERWVKAVLADRVRIGMQCNVTFMYKPLYKDTSAEPVIVGVQAARYWENTVGYAGGRDAPHGVSYYGGVKEPSFVLCNGRRTVGVPLFQPSDRLRINVDRRSAASGCGSATTATVTYVINGERACDPQVMGAIDDDLVIVVSALERSVRVKIIPPDSRLR